MTGKIRHQDGLSARFPTLDLAVSNLYLKCHFTKSPVIEGLNPDQVYGTLLCNFSMERYGSDTVLFFNLKLILLSLYSLLAIPFHSLFTLPGNKFVRAEIISFKPNSNCRMWFIQWPVSGLTEKIKNIRSNWPQQNYLSK